MVDCKHVIYGKIIIDDIVVKGTPGDWGLGDRKQLLLLPITPSPNTHHPSPITHHPRKASTIARIRWRSAMKSSGVVFGTRSCVTTSWKYSISWV